MLGAEAVRQTIIKDGRLLAGLRWDQHSLSKKGIGNPRPTASDGARQAPGAHADIL